MAAPEELDLDPIEPNEKPKGKGTKTARPVGPPKRPARADDEDESQKPRKSVAGNRKVPYPPSPAKIPEGLTDYPESFKRQQKLLLAGLVLFLTLYVGALLFCALITTWCIWSFWHWPLLKAIVLFFTSLTFLFLVKGFFKRHPMDRDTSVEITEEEHPVLFEFIYRLCEEVGSPAPNKVFVSADVNAACVSHTSLFSLFSEPKKDVLIGLGLVNAVNLSEFKAILAHEFGHFSHLGNTNNYVHIMQGVIIDMIRGEDLLDRLVAACRRSESFQWLGALINAPLWVGRTILFQMFKLIALQNMVVSREREFHADLVAVSAAGSNAATHGLLRARFGMQCFVQALHDMATALDHKMYSNDMYLHQSRAAAVVRRLKKEPALGLPPAISSPNEGQKVRVFDAEEDELEDQDETPPMWRSHPSDADREENAKERFVAAALDHRSPWILFDDVAELKERLTYKFYRMVFKIPKNADLTDALKVQKFIDNEHADTTYDPKYKGCYDDRPLEPGELSELNGIIRDKPWDEERLEKVYAKLYDGCEAHAEAHSELYKEEQALRSSIVGRPSPKIKRKLEELKEKQDENWEWFKSFDRRVYLLHVQMAAAVDKEQKDELVERYRFQLEVQRLYQESRSAFSKADAYLGAHDAWQRGEIQLPPDFSGEVIQVLRESWKALKHIIKDAREINLPAMKNFEEGERLADFILEGKMVPEPPLSYVKGVWINKLMTQLQGVRQKCFRLHFKSVGGILALQETIAAKWKEQREPVAAEVIDAEPLPADIIPADIVPADVVPAEVIPAEVIPAEVIPADVVPAEVVAEALPDDEPIAAPVIPALAPPPAEEPPKSVAAFIVPSLPEPAPVVRPEHRSVIPLVALPELIATPVAPVPPEPEPPVTPQVAEEPPAPAVEEPVVEAPVVEAPIVEVPATPAPVVEAPAEPVEPAVAPEASAAEPETLAVQAVEPPAPAPAEPVASTEPVAPASPPPAPEPVVEAEVIEAEVVEAEVIEAEVIEAEVVDAVEAPAPPPVAPARGFKAHKDISQTFSLDSGLPLPAKPKSFASPAPAAPVPAEEVFSLDDGAPDDPAPAEGFSLDADDHKPAPARKTDSSAGVQPKPVAPSGAGSGVFPPSITKPASGKRPALKITMVRPGERSPLSK